MTIFRFTCPPSVRSALPCTRCEGGARDCLFCDGTGSAEVHARDVLESAVEDAIRAFRGGNGVMAHGIASWRLLRGQVQVAEMLGLVDEAEVLGELTYAKTADDRCPVGEPYLLPAEELVAS